MTGISAGRSRRRFIARCIGAGIASPLLPGILWAKMSDEGTDTVTAAMVKAAAALAGLDFSDQDCQDIVGAVNESLEGYRKLRRLHIPYTVRPPFHFSPIVRGIEVSRKPALFRISPAPAVSRPANLEDAAYWPITHLAQLVRTRQVSSVELTEMYLGRLRNFDGKLNCVVTYLDDFARDQARRADTEIAAGNYKGPLHGIPWGVKDLMAVKGYPTTWGSRPFLHQVFDHDATVVSLLNQAGAVLIAKLSTGELAGAGDRWFKGRTNNPWNLAQGSTGSSAGSGAATAAGLVGFALGTDTGGSILSPSARCGIFGLRPTFGRISCYGVMPRAWTADRVGPMCRSVEDCAIVMQAIAKPDDRDLDVSDIPFRWQADLDVSKLRIGFVEEAFNDESRNPDYIRNDHETLRKLESMGFRLIPVPIPDFAMAGIDIGAESGASMDEFLRSGLERELSFEYRGNDFRPSRVKPAVEYLQGQRARTMMMEKLAEATAGVDVYLAPAAVGDDLDSTARVPPRAPHNQTQRHYAMGNLAAYPALAALNGFGQSGTPTSITFMAWPFREGELLAVAKAYQDATDFTSRHPVL